MAYSPPSADFLLRTILFNSTTPHVGTAARAVVGVATTVTLLVGGFVAFIWYRRRYNIHISSVSSSDATDMWSVSETYFMPSPLRISHGDPTPWMERQEPESGLPETVAANDDNREAYFHTHFHLSRLAYQLRRLHECARRLYTPSLPSLMQHRTKVGLSSSPPSPQPQSREQ